MIEHLSFTGSQTGMNADQAVTVLKVVKLLAPKKAHYGGCIGADEQFLHLMELFFPETIMHCYPASDVSEDKLATYIGDAIVHPSEPALVRNTNLVAIGDVLLATPHRPEYQRSGTWSTVRKARDCELPTFIVNPDGYLNVENASHLQIALLAAFSDLPLTLAQ